MANKRRKVRRRRKSSKFLNKNTSKLCLVLIVFIVVILLFCSFTVIKTLSYDRVFEGIYINQVNVSHMTRQELHDYIDEKYSKPLNNIIIDISADDKNWKLDASELQMKFNIDAIVNAVFDVGHNGSIFERLSNINDLKSNNLYINVFEEHNGEKLVTYNESIVDQLAAKISDSGAKAVVQHEVDIKEDAVYIVAGVNGYTFDTINVKRAILDAVNTQESCTLNIIDAATIIYPDNISANTYSQQINKAPVDAKYIFKDKLRKELIRQEGKNGFSVDSAALEEIIAKLPDNQGQSFNVPVTKIAPNVKSSDLKTPTFNDTLGTGSTKFSLSDTNRNTNLRISTETLNGVILLPGEQFSFNTIVGDTTEAKGYKKAAGYSSTGITQTTGGGICQVSTTLYNAVINSTNVKVDVRRNHSYTVSYVDYGLDCMISYGSSDFKFTNNTGYPIKIEGVYNASGTLTYRLKGVNEHKDTTYQFSTETKYTTKPSVSYTTNSSQRQTGKDGGQYVVTRTTLKNGVKIDSSYFSTSTYKALPHIKLQSSPSTPPSEGPSSTPSPSQGAPSPTPSQPDGNDIVVP